MFRDKAEYQSTLREFHTCIIDIWAARVDWCPFNLHKSAGWWGHKLSKISAHGEFPSKPACTASRCKSRTLQNPGSVWELELENQHNWLSHASMLSSDDIFLRYFCKSHAFYTYNKISLWLEREILMRHCQYRCRDNKIIGFNLLICDWLSLGLEGKWVLEWRDL